MYLEYDNVCHYYHNNYLQQKWYGESPFEIFKDNISHIIVDEVVFVNIGTKRSLRDLLWKRGVSEPRGHSTYISNSSYHVAQENLAGLTDDSDCRFTESLDTGNSQKQFLQRNDLQRRIYIADGLAFLKHDDREISLQIEDYKVDATARSSKKCGAICQIPSTYTTTMPIRTVDQCGIILRKCFCFS